MKALYQSLLLTFGGLALIGTSFAQVPSTNDTSDPDGNTGMGTHALGGPAATNGGSDNTASGYEALFSNKDGTQNTASGYAALAQNTSGNSNTAFGAYSLNSNVGAGNNSAFGAGALDFNSTGSDNTASGTSALGSNTTGSLNTATGSAALSANTTGQYNTASGSNALYRNKNGTGNMASGYGALANNSSGSHNTALGFEAGYDLTTGSNNIDIDNVGVAAEGGTIRIGTTSTQTKTFIAGIYGTAVTGSAVIVSSTGQLGVTVSSERYKTAIAPMGSDTAKLDLLRPVSFKLKSDATGTRQYGLIAEEVAKVYPELVIRDQNGRIDAVRYDELAPMLLNEMRHQARKLAALEEKSSMQARILGTQKEYIGLQAAEIRDLKRRQKAVGKLQKQMARMQGMLAKLRGNDFLVVRR